MEDLMGMFGNENGSNGGMMGDDMMNGFASLSMDGGGQQPPPPQDQMNGGGGERKTKEDLLGLF